MGKKKRYEDNPGKVTIPANHPNPPEQHEVDAALILARHFRCTVEFLPPVDVYMQKSPDIVMCGIIWEIKSPKGDSKSTIRNQFRRGSQQSKNIVIDVRRTKRKYQVVEKEVLFQIGKRP